MTFDRRTLTVFPEQENLSLTTLGDHNRSTTTSGSPKTKTATSTTTSIVNPTTTDVNARTHEATSSRLARSPPTEPSNHYPGGKNDTNPAMPPH